MENSVSNDVPEQTYNDDSLFRPMSLANVSGIADPSTDKSKMLHQIWNEHRSPRDTGTPLNEEEDIEGDHTSTPVVKVHSTSIFMYLLRECVRNLDLRVQVHPGELWVSKQRVHIVLEASKSAGAKGDVPTICGFVHPL